MHRSEHGKENTAIGSFVNRFRQNYRKRVICARYLPKTVAFFLRVRYAARMDILSPVRDHLASLSELQVDALARKTGVPLATLLKIKYGVTRNPRVATVQAVYTHLWPSGQESAPDQMAIRAEGNQAETSVP